jgi:hypothetical protein
MSGLRAAVRTSAQADASEGAVLDSCYLHRLLVTSQVRALHFPTHDLRWTQKVLRRMVDKGVLECQQRRRTDEKVFFVTDKGGRIAEAGQVTARRHRQTRDSAEGSLREHTLAVNDVGVKFVETARARGDECSPADWQHEQLFRVPNARLVPDAVLHYSVCHDNVEELIVRFLEIDRATESLGKLVEKLRVYDKLHARGAWQDRFIVFPKVLVVLCGRDRAALVRRRDTLLALCRVDTTLRRSEVTITVTTLEELVERGPFDRIFWDPNLETPVDLVGEGAPPEPEVHDDVARAAPATSPRQVRSGRPPLRRPQAGRPPPGSTGTQLQLIDGKPDGGGRR